MIPDALSIASAVLALTAALTLFYGSIGIPWKNQSWSGETPAELRWQRKQTIMKWVGIPSAIGAAVAQIGATLPS